MPARTPRAAYTQTPVRRSQRRFDTQSRTFATRHDDFEQKKNDRRAMKGRSLSQCRPSRVRPSDLGAKAKTKTLGGLDDATSEPQQGDTALDTASLPRRCACANSPKPERLPAAKSTWVSVTSRQDARAHGTSAANLVFASLTFPMWVGHSVDRAGQSQLDNVSC